MRRTTQFAIQCPMIAPKIVGAIAPAKVPNAQEDGDRQSSDLERKYLAHREIGGTCRRKSNKESDRPGKRLRHRARNTDFE